MSVGVIHYVDEQQSLTIHNPYNITFKEFLSAAFQFREESPAGEAEGPNLIDIYCTDCNAHLGFTDDGAYRRIQSCPGHGGVAVLLAPSLANALVGDLVKQKFNPYEELCMIYLLKVFTYLGGSGHERLDPLELAQSIVLLGIFGDRILA